jgi:methionine sulfoxide reductase heme-binding subunit
MLGGAMAISLALWRDRRGRVSGLRLAVLALQFVPVLLAAETYLTAGFGARPLNDLIHRTGYWALLFVLLTLTVTPLARIGRLAGLIDVRRMIGVGAFVYAAAHILLFIADQSFNLFKVASEIVLRLYLTIGFIALTGLTALAVTSTDAMIKRLGVRRWQTLHRIVYGIALLGLIHFFQQTKADVWLPTFAAGLFVWLMGYRVLARLSGPEPTIFGLFALTVVASALTILGEALGIALYYGVSPWLVLQSSLEFDFDMIRPGWLVLGAGLCVVALAAGRMLWRKAQRSGGLSPAHGNRTAGKSAA